MEKQYNYKNIEERKTKIIEAEGQGLRMLCDNFDADWKPDDVPHGIMTFTDITEEQNPELSPNLLMDKIVDLEVRVKKLEGVL